MGHALEIKNLKKSYNGNPALDGISFTVEKGEFFGFLGPNGAGKTTTIHSITGISSFDEGSISLFSLDVVKDYRRARRMVGLSSQEFNVEVFSKVWKVLDYVGGFYGMRKGERRERVSELLGLFNLGEHKDKEFRELSGGLKRRVVLARAMMHNPELLILDEPTAGLDVELRHSLWNYLRALSKEGKTIFLTSHYLEEVEFLCNRIAIINKGKIAMIGGKDDFIKDGKRLEDTYLKITRGEGW